MQLRNGRLRHITIVELVATGTVRSVGEIVSSFHADAGMDDGRVQPIVHDHIVLVGAGEHLDADHILVMHFVHQLGAHIVFLVVLEVLQRENKIPGSGDDVDESLADAQCFALITKVFVVRLELLGGTVEVEQRLNRVIGVRVVRIVRERQMEIAKRIKLLALGLTVEAFVCDGDVATERPLDERFGRTHSQFGRCGLEGSGAVRLDQIVVNVHRTGVIVFGNR